MPSKSEAEFTAPVSLSVIVPCYNENLTMVRFLERLWPVISGLSMPVEVIVVDDHSSDATLERLREFGERTEGKALRLLALPVHVGQQGAIQAGLKAALGGSASHILVMDGDGEDRPEAIPELLRHASRDIVHASRGRRHEGISFRMAYYLYRALFWLVTQRTMDFGNFSLIHRRVLVQILQSPLLHFPARLRKAEGSRLSIRVDRGHRLGGVSKMRWQGLVYHAFHSLLEFSDDLLMVFFKIFVVNLFLFAAAGCYVLYHKFITGRAISGWTSLLGIGLLNLAMISFGFFVLGILITSLRRQLLSSQTDQPASPILFSRHDRDS